MNRQTRTLVVIAVAVLTASAASYAVYRAIARIPGRPVEVPTPCAVVATKPMSTGTLVTKESVKLVAWPSRTPLPTGFTDIDAGVNRGVIAAVHEHETLSERKIA